MTTTPGSTRRSFIRTAGAALSVPLASAAVAAPAAAGDDPLKARLARLEDLEQIRALHQAYARHVNAGRHEAAAALFAEPAGAALDADVRSIAPDPSGEQDVIEIAPDRETATAVLHCMVQVERAIGPSCPLVDMARQQGGGIIRRTARAVLENVYVRRDGVWQIQRVSSRVT